MRKSLTMLALAAVLGGCAGMPRMSDAERLALYRSHAGEEVRSFTLFGRPSGWTPLGEEALVVWTRPREAWLLELAGRCQDLDHAPGMTLTSTGSQVQARFDEVIPLGPGVSEVGRIPCRIQSIRRVDVAGLRQAQQELREAAVKQREAEATP
ncbi:MAG: DUF6491 family protein [Lysobacteraceae bacterium]|jgi:hypothetical protein|nr:hypothetical protein [Xanthomonadaceae bacterium]